MRSAVSFSIVLATLALAYIPQAAAQNGQEGPIELDKCQAIGSPGSYRLVKNITAPANADCFTISANFVTIDLAGFTITGRGSNPGKGIVSTPQSAGAGPKGIAVRNGSVSNVSEGVDLAFTDGSIIEEVRVSCASLPSTVTNGIANGQAGSTGITRSNTVTGCQDGMTAAGIVTGNNVIGIGAAPPGAGIDSDSPSTVIGNTSTNFTTGFIVFCPSNVTNNTAVHNSTNYSLVGTGCSNVNNVAP